ncbi:molecular chaperone DnaJ [Sphingomonas profundi]|uniref:molecular chaperone DnaJ n=1 Tax=Alterirhizorhabdus profundi TaxID=2681549 RepID=UPI0012E8C213|nr:molecular chaperone DnaJ [Sphingomonas profundi]
MSLLLLAAASIGIWAWRTGRWRRFGWGDIAAIVAGLLAIRLMTRGEWLPALVGAGWSAGWLWFGRREWLRRRPAFAAAMPIEEARGLLGLPAAADAAMIRAAHRRLIQRVHPDAGGSAELARRVNGARDVLLAELNRSRPRAS